MQLEVGKIVFCTVKKIVGTTVFISIDNYNKEGTIMTSEIAPGRIRNLRDYVVPNKRIVCKILRMDDKDHIDLSLRRVTLKEQKEVKEAYKKEKSLAATLKTIIKDAEPIIQKIKEKESLVDFLEDIKENPGKLDGLMSKEEAEKLIKILNEKKEKEVFVKKNFLLSCRQEDGINRIKSILPKEATYIGAGKFSVEVKDTNYKNANHKVDETLKEVESKAKNNKCIFEFSKQK